MFPFVKTWSSCILPRDLERINPWCYHKIRTTHIPAILRAYLQKWNMVFDFLFFWFCIQRKITKSINFTQHARNILFTLKGCFSPWKKKKKKKKTEKGEINPLFPNQSRFPFEAFYFVSRSQKEVPDLLLWRVFKIVGNVLIL